ncbi:MAG: hypothetical protein K2H39_07875 [Paramuribaculum sp.]|nr:hypothetical protein [Paramuribaculum sp.]
MKKVLLLMSAVLAFVFSSCSDESDLPLVEIDTACSGAVMVDGTLYVVQDSTFEITAITAEPIREGKKAAVTSVVYSLDGWIIGSTDVAPFGVTFEPGTFSVGKHLLGMQMVIAEEGCSPAVGYYANDLVVVSSVDEIPAATTPSGRGASFKVHPSIQEQ